MRVSGQLAVIVVLGAAGFGGWYAYKGGHLANVPVIGAYVSQPSGQQADAGRLAGTIGAEQRGDLAGAYRQVEPGKHRIAPEPFRHAFQRSDDG